LGLLEYGSKTIDEFVQDGVWLHGVRRAGIRLSSALAVGGFAWDFWDQFQADARYPFPIRAARAGVHGLGGFGIGLAAGGTYTAAKGATVLVLGAAGITTAPAWVPVAVGVTAAVAVGVGLSYGWDEVGKEGAYKLIGLD
jgi:hypothetical protein